MNELLKSSENLVSQFSLIISPNHSRVEITRTEYSCFIYTHVYNFARRFYDCKSTILYCASLIKFHYILVSTSAFIGKKIFATFTILKDHKAQIILYSMTGFYNSLWNYTQTLNYISNDDILGFGVKTYGKQLIFSNFTSIKNLI